MRKIIAIIACKLSILIGNIMGKKSSSTPGKIALKICPNILELLAQNVTKKTIAVCGTNGKTTTSNVICDALEHENNTVICNRHGANMLPGVVTAFISATNIWGTGKSDYAVIEVDENSAPVIFSQLNIDYIVVTNFFRDQLDRYGEIDVSIGKVEEGVKNAPNAVMVLNADDPLVVSSNFGDNRRIYFGVGEKVSGGNEDETREGRYCRNCGEAIEYDFFQYSQLGHYKCRGCDFKRPAADYEATDFSFRGVFTKFKVAGRTADIKIRGFYNVYNMLAAFAVSSDIGLSAESVLDVFREIKTQTGRMEEYRMEKPVIFNLSKNPAGFNQTVDTIVRTPGKKAVVMVLNDNAQDGKDISWIWDVNMERLADENLEYFVACGTRALDLVVRLKYCDFDLDKVKHTKSVELAVSQACAQEVDIVYVLVNYTALFTTEKVLKRLEEKALCV